MGRTRIKICGICRAEDAVFAADAGADAIGLVLYPPAKRHVTLERAKQILDALPAFVTPVGLFVDQETRYILDVAEELRLRHVQLHGRETPQQIAELRGLSIIKALPVNPADFAQQLQFWRDAIASLRLNHLKGFVLETAGTTGGSGISNDWATIRLHRERGDFDGLPPMIAAGGLNPHNVAAVVRDVRPWAVDVSSGVESITGQKSHEKVQAFINAVHAVDGA